MKFSLFRKLCVEWLVFWALSVGVLMSSRLYLLFRYTEAQMRSDYAADVSALLLKGLLFDIKISSILTAVAVLPALLALLHRRVLAWVAGITPYLLALLLVSVAALSVVNVFYYSVYDRQFDVFVFGLVEEDTVAVLKTIWQDYPVVWGLLGLAVLVWALKALFSKLHGRLDRAKFSDGLVISNVLLVVGLVAGLTLGIRGSLGKFPLRQSSAQISTQAVLNKLVPNGLTSLSWAVSEYRNSQIFEVVDDESGRKLFGTMLGREAASADFNELKVLTPENAAAAAGRPNVVLAVMESMSGHMLQLDSPQRDLLGSLRSHFQNDWVFHRFVSEGDGTSDSLHRLFIRSPYNNLSQSAAKSKFFPTNMFTPYLEAGYKVVYLTAGNGGWRDFDRFTKHLGVHEFVDENRLRELYPDAETFAWGVPDEYMFRYAADRLQKAEQDREPVFIMMMSITHHPPYQLPATGARSQYVFSDEERRRFSQMENMNEVFNTYRYANNALGDFIDSAKKVGNTIVAATGDHNIRGIGYPDISEAALGHAVPFYLYVPQQYRGQAVYRAERVGSHKDIMPTLYEFSLSGQPYYRTGCNMLSDDAGFSGNPWCGYGYNAEVALFPKGMYDLRTRQYYVMEQGLQVAARPSEIPEDVRLSVEKSKHYGAFLSWLTNRMATAPGK